MYVFKKYVFSHFKQVSCIFFKSFLFAWIVFLFFLFFLSNGPSLSLKLAEFPQNEMISAILNISTGQLISELFTRASELVTRAISLDPRHFHWIRAISIDSRPAPYRLSLQSIRVTAVIFLQNIFIQAPNARAFRDSIYKDSPT